MLSQNTYYLIICLLALIVVIWGRILLRSLRRASKTSTFFSLALLSIACSLLIIELGVHFFYVQSDFFGFTRTAARWWDLYWKPINEQGFRERKLALPSTQDERIAFILGDSIIAGQGIEDLNARFSNLIEHHLGNPWRVYAIAKCGWNTTHELNALAELLAAGHRPRLVVLSYFVNDIEGAGQKAGHPLPSFITNPPFGSSLLVRNSALINLLYWRIYRTLNAEIAPRYWQFIESIANDPKVWENHLPELQRFVELSKQHNFSLAVVLFPFIPAPGIDDLVLNKVAQFFAAEDVQVIDLRPSLRSYSTEQLVVNSTDHHPNELMHKLAADKSMEVLRSILSAAR